MFCPGSGTKQTQPGLALACPAAFADINTHKSRSVGILLVGRLPNEENLNEAVHCAPDHLTHHADFCGWTLSGRHGVMVPMGELRCSKR